MYKILPGLLLLLVMSCSTDVPKELVAEPIEKEVHENLLGFKVDFLAELGSGKYFQLEPKVEDAKLEVKYINDVIYVSFYDELNSCGEYEGNLEISNDSILLYVISTNDLACTSTVIDRITFLIDNPDEKKKVIIRN